MKLQMNIWNVLKPCFPKIILFLLMIYFLPSSAVFLISACDLSYLVYSWIWFNKIHHNLIKLHFVFFSYIQYEKWRILYHISKLKRNDPHNYHNTTSRYFSQKKLLKKIEEKYFNKRHVCVKYVKHFWHFWVENNRILYKNRPNNAKNIIKLNCVMNDTISFLI